MTNHNPPSDTVDADLMDNGAALPQSCSRQHLFDTLDALGIAHTTLDHPPAFTVEDGGDIKAQLPGGHTKNLFLADKSGNLVLICALAQTRVDVNRIHRALNEAGAHTPAGAPYQRFSFGSPEMLAQTLAATPGSVTFFGLINNEARDLTLILDAALLHDALVNFHPLRNDATTTIASAQLVTFAKFWGGRAFFGHFDADAIRLEKLS